MGYERPTDWTTRKLACPALPINRKTPEIVIDTWEYDRIQQVTVYGKANWYISRIYLATTCTSCVRQGCLWRQKSQKRLTDLPLIIVLQAQRVWVVSMWNFAVHILLQVYILVIFLLLFFYFPSFLIFPLQASLIDSVGSLFPTLLGIWTYWFVRDNLGLVSVNSPKDQYISGFWEVKYP